MTVPPTASPGRRLRDAWEDETLAIPGVFNALVARMAERLGFRAMYLSGAALSASTGVPDVGLLGLAEFVEEARRLTAASSLPLLCDADTGFGEALNVERTVRLMEAAGVAGIHLEDQQMPKRCGHLSGKQLIAAQEMAAKVRAAVAARRDQDFVIIARTDARGVTGFDDAVRGPSCISTPAPTRFSLKRWRAPRSSRRSPEAVPAPLLANMTEFGKGPLLDFAELAALGYRMVLYPVTALRAALRAAQETLADILRQGPSARPPAAHADPGRTVRLAGLSRLRGARSCLFRSDEGAFMSDSKETYSPGLEGVIAGETAISTVADGLSYRGYPVTELAEKTSFDEVAYLLLHGELPNAAQLAAFQKRVAAARQLPAPLSACSRRCRATWRRWT